MSDLSLKDVMRTFPQGVTVVTAEGDGGPRGVTVSSFTSVSVAPPLVLICILKESRSHDAIKKGKFVVNVLAEGQSAVELGAGSDSGEFKPLVFGSPQYWGLGETVHER